MHYTYVALQNPFNKVVIFNSADFMLRQAINRWLEICQDESINIVELKSETETYLGGANRQWYHHSRSA
jgi:hypothetical protein